MIEVWKPVIGYEDIYHVSNLGNIKSLSRTLRDGRKWSERLLNPVRLPLGYMIIELSNNGRKKRHLVHRLVAEAFLEKTAEHVNHLNGIKDDNRCANLEWVSHRENVCHGGLVKRGLAGTNYRPKRNRWIATFQINGKRKHLGTFKTEIEAHNAYLAELVKQGIGNKYANIQQARNMKGAKEC